MNEEHARLIGLFGKRSRCTIKNFKEQYGDVAGIEKVLKTTKEVIAERKNVLITGDISTSKTHLGIGILKRMLMSSVYLDALGDIIPEKVRYIKANRFVNALHNESQPERKLLWDNLFIAYDDGSGHVGTIMVDDLGAEFGRDAENYMKLIVDRCDDEDVQLIVTTDLDDDQLSKRYGEKVAWLLTGGVIIKLVGTKDVKTSKKTKPVAEGDASATEALDPLVNAIMDSVVADLFNLDEDNVIRHVRMWRDAFEDDVDLEKLFVKFCNKINKIKDDDSIEWWRMEFFKQFTKFIERF